uniref:metallophosphoesterase family protein n=1 Tax=Acetatifactor sp. TaxID=1872090 RepID=UPI00402592EB
MKINKKELTIEGLQEEYYFLHITDTHAGRENLTRDGISAAERLKEYVEYANEERLSGVLLTGDIIDNPAMENLTLLKRQLEALQVPYLYIPGNHDWALADDYHTDVATSRDWPLLQPFCLGEETFQVKKIGEITWIGIDNSMDMYWPGTAVKLRKVLAERQNDNVIILQHIPFDCGTLAQASMHRWGKVLTLGRNLPEQGTRKEADTDRSADIKEIIIQAGNVKALICGHLHTDHKDMLSERIPQYVSNESCFGEVTVFRIHG